MTTPDGLLLEPSEAHRILTMLRRAALRAGTMGATPPDGEPPAGPTTRLRHLSALSKVTGGAPTASHRPRQGATATTARHRPPRPPA